MSDDKSKDKTASNPPSSDGTGSTTDDKSGAVSVGFGELLGHIDSRIEAILSKRKGADGDSKAASEAGAGDPGGIREQLRAELAKLQGEEAAKKREADRDVTIQELKETVSKLTEEKPAENYSKLTQLMWGKRSKT